MIGRAVATLLLCLGALAILLPFFWMLSISLKPADEIFSPEIRLLPGALEWRNYVTAFTEVELARFLWNGAVVCLGILVFQILFAVPCAYALAQRRFRLRTPVFALVLAGLLVPFHVTAIPLFLGLAQLKLLNSYAALILPFVASVFGIFLFRQFFKGFPDEVIQAARLDGMSEFEIVWRIVVPSARPAIAAFSVFSITAHWNDLYWPLIVVTRDERATPPLGVAFFFDPDTGTDFALLMASAAIISAPLVLAFLLAQRTFIHGITMTGVK